MSESQQANGKPTNGSAGRYFDDLDLVTDGRKIFSPVEFPTGHVAPNRLFKTAVYEHFNPHGGGPPHSGHYALYRRWAKAGYGIILTGNTMVAKDHLTLGRDLVIPEEITDDILPPWQRLADVMHNVDEVTGEDPPREDGFGRPLALIQLSHAGRQSLNVVGGRPPNAPPLGASPIRAGQSHMKTHGWFSRWLHRNMHPVPIEMTKDDIQNAIAQFVRGAELAARCGFDGVQIHGAHGYLVSTFMMLKSNIRTDEYSAETDPLRFLREICFAVRANKNIPEKFLLGVKINSGDYARDGTRAGSERPLAHVREIGSWGIVDFIEVSGGDYEDPEFVDSAASFKSPRQVIFEDFAEKSMKVLAEFNKPGQRPPPLVVLTGGLTTLPRMASVLAHDHAHLLGVGRLSITHPEAPRQLKASIEKRARGEPDDAFMRDTHKLEEDGLGMPPPSYFSLRALERVIYYWLTLLWKVIPAEMPRIMCASGNVNWHNVMLRSIAFGGDVDYTVGTIGATVRFYLPGVPYAPSDPKASKGSSWFPLFVVLAGVAIGVALGGRFA
ncbi:FMN-linked oxidoreductase [Cubamyces sp. BRFM 1775]|nr:FMN-linked oxidoreductase [Cubamyces sp. BRFM 1775]